MSSDHDFATRWVKNLSDAQLLDLYSKTGPQDSGYLMAAVGIFCPMALIGLVSGVFVRAAERSSTIDIATWCVLATLSGAGTFVALRTEKKAKATTDLWLAVLQEKNSRNL